MEMARSCRFRIAGTVLPLFGVIAIMMCFAGCGDSREAPVWLPRYRGEVSGDGASLRGTIVREGNCLYVGEGEFRVLPIFPENSSFDEKNGKLTVLGKTFRVGGQFRSGGGELKVLDYIRDDLITAPDASCDTSLMWIVGDV